MVGRGEFMDVHEAWVRGKSISEIARLTGRDRKMIRRLLREGGPTPRKPRQVSSKLDPFRGYLLGRVLGEDPVTNAEVLYDEIRERGYEGGRTILKEFLHPFRQLAREKVTRRFETPPSDSDEREDANAFSISSIHSTTGAMNSACLSASRSRRSDSPMNRS